MIWFKDNLSEEELKKEYRKLCKKFHPDVSKDPNAEVYMKEINEQFDQYWSNQKIREFEWVDTWKAKQEARKYRATVLVWLRRDQFNPGKFYSIVDEKHTWYWFWKEYIKIKGVTDDGPEWEGFRGGLAYCEYDSSNNGYQSAEVSLKKLPATITPASLAEVYYFNKDHWSDSRYHLMYKIQCRFGTFIASDRDYGYTFYVKAELPEKFLKIGNVSDEAKYSARSINLVYVDYKWIKEAKTLEVFTGADVPYLVYQECTEDDFNKYHDTDKNIHDLYQYIRGVGCKVVRDDMFVDNPIVAMCIRNRILTIHQSSRNFRIRCGYFNTDELKRNIHLFSIDDIEEVQDYLDDINKEFIDHFKALVRRGKISMKI